MASKREQVVEAVRSLVAAALPLAGVRRNLDKPERIPSGGLVIVRDGDPGEPEVLLSPLSYTYSHRVVLELAAYASDPLTREQVLDAMLAAIGAAVITDRTLGGLCLFLDTEAPSSDNLETLGAASARWAEAVIVATYTTSNPLT